MTLKSYGGGAIPTTLNGSILSGTTAIPCTALTSWPTTVAAPLVAAIDLGLATEEKILCTRSGNTLTATTRGYDGTVAQAHGDGATVHHVVDAITLEEANRLANLTTTRGDLIARGAAADQRLALGAAGALLRSNGTDPGWLTPGAAGSTLIGGPSPSWLAIGAAATALISDGATPAWTAIPPDIRRGFTLTRASMAIAAASASTDISWDTEVQDTDTFWTAGSTVTIPAGLDGPYAITFIFTVTSALSMRPYIKTSRYGTLLGPADAGGNLLVMSAMQLLAAGDTLEVGIKMLSGSATTATGCRLNGYRLSA